MLGTIEFLPKFEIICKAAIRRRNQLQSTVKYRLCFDSQELMKWGDERLYNSSVDTTRIWLKPKPFTSLKHSHLHPYPDLLYAINVTDHPKDEKLIAPGLIRCRLPRDFKDSRAMSLRGIIRDIFSRYRKAPCHS
ncbi:hypothetical protein RF11_03111 [Thelohanellus kitauei]|uniref:Uncharacterized protein n=1 Tax=Thelohanellus kitauei TaxID=669202 RepID=A0A0C2JHN8_THEKT|nr:hypothetical protein RF11_03111 [Thelohanellus kitauei]